MIFISCRYSNAEATSYATKSRLAKNSFSRLLVKSKNLDQVLADSSSFCQDSILTVRVSYSRSRIIKKPCWKGPPAAIARNLIMLGCRILARNSTSKAWSTTVSTKYDGSWWLYASGRIALRQYRKDEVWSSLLVVPWLLTLLQCRI